MHRQWRILVMCLWLQGCQSYSTYGICYDSSVLAYQNGIIKAVGFGDTVIEAEQAAKQRLELQLAQRITRVERNDSQFEHGHYSESHYSVSHTTIEQYITRTYFETLVNYCDDRIISVAIYDSRALQELFAQPLGLVWQNSDATVLLREPSRRAFLAYQQQVVPLHEHDLFEVLTNSSPSLQLVTDSDRSSRLRHNYYHEIEIHYRPEPSSDRYHHLVHIGQGAYLTPLQLDSTQGIAVKFNQQYPQLSRLRGEHLFMAFSTPEPISKQWYGEIVTRLYKRDKSQLFAQTIKQLKVRHIRPVTAHLSLL